MKRAVKIRSFFVKGVCEWMSHQWTFMYWQRERFVSASLDKIENWMYWVEGSFRVLCLSLIISVRVQKYTSKKKKTEPQISRSHCELPSVMAELLWRRREVVTLVPSDVGTDAAALAPPLITVSSQTGESNKTHPWRNHLLWLCHIRIRSGESFIFTWLGCSEAWRSTPGHRHCRNGVGCQRNKP